MILFGTTKQAALEKESSAYCLRNEKQLLCVWGDSKACKMKQDKSNCQKPLKTSFFCTFFFITNDTL